MITEKIFKKIIQTQFALIITTFVLVAFETEIYPLVDEDLSFTFSDSILLMWAIGYIISIRLLYKFKPLGKKLYVIILILGLTGWGKLLIERIPNGLKAGIILGAALAAMTTNIPIAYERFRWP